MYTYYIFNRKNRLNIQAEAPIELVIYWDRNRREFKSPNISVRDTQWDDEKKKVINHPRDKVINAALRRFQVEQEEKAELRNTQPDKNFVCFNDFYKVQMEQTKNLTASTLNSHAQTLHFLNLYNPKLRFDMINHSFPARFENFLIGQKLAINTISKHHKNVKVYLNHAINNRQYSESPVDWPYRDYNVKKEPGKKEAINEADMKLLEALELSPTTRMSLVRDMFLFACYTGLRFSDVTNIQPQKDVENVGEAGMILTNTSIKTHTTVYLPLDQLFAGKPRKIYDKYYDPEQAYLFPNISNATVNEALKELQLRTGLRKPLSFHYSRHTFLTTIAAKTGDVFQVKRLGGIQKTETAMIYIHLADERFGTKLKGIVW